VIEKENQLFWGKPKPQLLRDEVCVNFNGRVCVSCPTRCRAHKRRRARPVLFLVVHEPPLSHCMRLHATRGEPLHPFAHSSHTPGHDISHTHTRKHTRTHTAMCVSTPTALCCMFLILSDTQQTSCLLLVSSVHIKPSAWFFVL